MAYGTRVTTITLTLVDVQGLLASYIHERFGIEACPADINPDIAGDGQYDAISVEGFTWSRSQDIPENAPVKAEKSRRR